MRQASGPRSAPTISKISRTWKRKPSRFCSAGLIYLFAAENAISGFQFSNPGYAGKGYALSLAKVDAAVIFPEANAVLSKAAR